MISLVILGVIFIVSVIIMSVKMIENVFLSVFLSAAIILALSIIPVAISTSLETVKADEINSIKIYALKDNGGVNGSFFLGCGQIESEMYYIYLVADGNGYKMRKICCDNVTIVETSKQSRIVNYRMKYKKESVNLWIPEFFIDNKTIIEIPSGSIKYDFKVDLE
jgi:hypothetical protein